MHGIKANTLLQLHSNKSSTLLTAPIGQILYRWAIRSSDRKLPINLLTYLCFRGKLLFLSIYYFDSALVLCRVPPQNGEQHISNHFKLERITLQKTATVW